jgi:anion-transporting  ArsA/GET3 family ATPase
MQTFIFTGNGDLGTGLAAAATAALAARAGRRTLLASFGPSHSVAALSGTALAASPQAVEERLDLWTLDINRDIDYFWTQLSTTPGVSSSRVIADEIPLLSGFDLFVGAARLREFAPAYETIIVDVGPHDGLLRALAVPDSMRWLTRLLLGIDRGPGRDPASAGRALLPVSLLPFSLDWVSQVQDARVEFERLRDETLDLSGTALRYVLRPDRPGFAAALTALPALHLYGIAVDTLILGPFLPWASEDNAVAEMRAEQLAVAGEAAQIWATIPQLSLPGGSTPSDVAALEALGESLYAGVAPDERRAQRQPVRYGDASDPSIQIDLPGVERGVLGLTLSGDELVVRIGPFRRHLLLPDNLRGITNIKAVRDGDTLVIRPRDV